MLGGCCCSHVGAVQGLAARHERLAVVWIDAHGDLNTPETSPSGNEWGMPLRMLLDAGVVEPARVWRSSAPGTSIRPRSSTSPKPGIDDSLERALAGGGAVYVALDLDVLDPEEADMFMPEPDGLSVAAVEDVLRETASSCTVVGIGVTGFLPRERNVGVVTRLVAAAGL